MSMALRKPMTLAEFLAWEERQDLCWEFDGFELVAMTGGTAAHETIGGNVRAVLMDRLRGGRCRVFGPTLKVEVAGRIRYPDAFVVCSPVPAATTVVHDPVVVFEVLSAGTARTDMVRKLGEYAATASIQRYIILQQDFIGGLNLTRQGERFVADPLAEDSVLRMPELGIEVPVADFYTGLEYEPPDDADDR
ncbi:MAG: Uma2 family endonuclease [Acetobacteraceae bacterium]